ncbi:MAG: methyltransferase domain-containing protein [Deltaproteobacteria bacterium]|nr:methyltransferase domain-containing protein [Deltaproteobacteria bacterium]
MEQHLYSPEELALVPEVALNLSRGCGNPTGFANIQRGEVAADFGCGGGIDVILAANKVGPEGRVIGIDFAPQMIERARQAVAAAGLHRNIEFVIADLDKTELPNSSVDVVISNCVINLIPDKEAVYREASRILKSGGRIAISDIVLSQAIDPELQERFQSTWPGCLGGAIIEADYLQIFANAGFARIQMVARHLLTTVELAAMACCPGEEFTPAPAPEDLAAVQGKVASIKFKAVKQLG